MKSTSPKQDQGAYLLHRLWYEIIARAPVWQDHEALSLLSSEHTSVAFPLPATFWFCTVSYGGSSVTQIHLLNQRSILPHPGASLCRAGVDWLTLEVTSNGTVLWSRRSYVRLLHYRGLSLRLNRTDTASNLKGNLEHIWCIVQLLPKTEMG